MLVAGHIGGSLNFNSVALHFDLANNANAFAVLLTVDHIMIVSWMMITVLLPKLQKTSPIQNSNQSLNVFDGEGKSTENIDLSGFNLLGMLVILALIVSDMIVDWLKLLSVNIPTILIISCLALVVSHLPVMKKISGHNTLGEIFVYLFLIVIGAHTDFNTLYQYSAISLNILFYITSIFVLHSIFAFYIGSYFVKDFGILALGSQACIGGPVSAAALARSIGRNDLTVPSIIAGSLGGALGTFIGFAVISIL